MKWLIAILIMMLPLTSNAQCLFGETTWDLEGQWEEPDGPRVFYRGEQFNLSKPERLEGLTPIEKDMISQAVHPELRGLEPQEQLREFSLTDGVLTYFSHQPTGRQFLQVTHYPGDNEYGAILEIKVHPEGTEVLGVVAQIRDGQIQECQFR